jgi:predicted nucleic acid-binding protein
MKWLVDVNVLGEPLKSSPDAKVIRWLRRHELDLAVDPIILGEVHFGILSLPASRRRQRLELWFTTGVVTIKCLPWDAAVGLRWARLLVDLRRLGQAMPIKDSMIAATALVHGLTVATHNVADFRRAGVRVVDPFG